MQHWLCTSGDGNVTEAGTRDPDHDAMCDTNIMFVAAARRIFSAGGAQSYSNSDAWTVAHVTTNRDPYQPSQAEHVGDLTHPPGLANAIVLVDGNVLITGGQARSIIFIDTNAWRIPEMWNPVTRTFTELVAATIPQHYHSISLLLPDARVLFGGGGWCETPANQSDAQYDRATDHPEVEILSPPYLFRSDNRLAERPAILKVASPSIGSGHNVVIGGQVLVEMNHPDDHSFSLVRTGGVAHSTNTDQRSVPLDEVVKAQATFTIQLPNDLGVLIPGFHYLFAISQIGVCIVAKTIRVRLGV